jgi:P-type Ca2+ transporter type 2C
LALGLCRFFAQKPQLGIAIWLVILMNGAFSFGQEYKVETATAALRRLLPTYARVLRNDMEQRIPAEAHPIPSTRWYIPIVRWLQEVDTFA